MAAVIEECKELNKIIESQIIEELSDNEPMNRFFKPTYDLLDEQYNVLCSLEQQAFTEQSAATSELQEEEEQYIEEKERVIEQLTEDYDLITQSYNSLNAKMDECRSANSKQQEELLRCEEQLHESEVILVETQRENRQLEEEIKRLKSEKHEFSNNNANEGQELCTVLQDLINHYPTIRKDELFTQINELINNRQNCVFLVSSENVIPLFFNEQQFVPCISEEFGFEVFDNKREYQGYALFAYLSQKMIFSFTNCSLSGAFLKLEDSRFVYLQRNDLTHLNVSECENTQIVFVKGSRNLKFKEIVKLEQAINWDM